MSEFSLCCIFSLCKCSLYFCDIPIHIELPQSIMFDASVFDMQFPFNIRLYINFVEVFFNSQTSSLGSLPKSIPFERSCVIAWCYSYIIILGRSLVIDRHYSYKFVTFYNFKVTLVYWKCNHMLCFKSWKERI